MIADGFGNFFYSFRRSAEKLFGFFKPDFLYVGRVSHSGFVFYQPVKVILLKVEGIGKIPYCNRGEMMSYIFGYLFENKPVHGFSLFF